MLLSARVITDVANVNSFEFTSSQQWTEGDSSTLYFQLINSELDTALQGYNPAGRRFCPPSTSTLTVTVQNIDDGRTVTRIATQPFPEDASIWSIPILVTDKVRGTPQIKLKLVTPTQTLFGTVKGAIRVQSATEIC